MSIGGIGGGFDPSKLVGGNSGSSPIGGGAGGGLDIGSLLSGVGGAGGAKGASGGDSNSIFGGGANQGASGQITLDLSDPNSVKTIKALASALGGPEGAKGKGAAPEAPKKEEKKDGGGDTMGQVADIAKTVAPIAAACCF